MTKIELEKDELALIVQPNGATTFYIPGMEADDIVPEDVIILTAVAAMWRDKEFREFVVRKMVLTEH